MGKLKLKADLQDKKPAREAGTHTRFVPGLGEVPYKIGDVYLSDRERRDLAAVGWKEGDPIPEGLAAYIAQVQAEFREEAKTTMPQGEGPGRPQEVDISQLPPEKQRELRAFMAQAKTMQESQVQAEAGITPAMHPSVADAVRMASQEPETLEPASAVEKLKRKLHETTDSPESDSPARPDPASETKASPAPLCPRCGWDLGRTEPVIADADKINFVAAVLGKARFVKTYTFFDGKLEVTYRSLTVNQSDMVLNRLAFEAEQGQVADRNSFQRKFWDYRLCLALQTVRNGGQTTDVSESVDEFLSAASDKEEALPQLLQQLQSNHPFSEDFLWRIMVGTYAKEFQELVDLLEAKAAQPSFWQAIGG